MKKIVSIVIFFIVSILIGYFVTKAISDGSDEIKDPITQTDTNLVLPDTIPSDTDIIDLDVPPSPSVPDPVSTTPIPPTPPTPPTPPVQDPEPKSTTPSMSNDELKALIMNGGYEKDSRLAKGYSIEYVDVNEDDIEGLQQNFAQIQQFVEFGQWSGFDVVGIEYNSEGKVNHVKIKPRY